MGSDDITVQGPAFEPGLSVSKSADVSEVTTAGQQISYSYIIANTGNVTITDQPVLLDDRIDAADLSCAAIPAGGLLPLGSILCSGVYDVTQADVDAGGVTNIATVSVPNIYNPGELIEGTDSVTVPAVRSPDMTVTKVASVTSDVAVGDVITYTYTVENTGNVTLAPITLVDQHRSAAGAVELVIEDGGVIDTLAQHSDRDASAAGWHDAGRGERG